MTPNDRGAARGHSRSAIPGYLPPRQGRYLPPPTQVPCGHGTVSPTSLPRSTYTRDRRPTFCCTTGMEGKESPKNRQDRVDLAGSPLLILIFSLSSILACRIVHLPAVRGPGYYTVHRRGRLGPSRIFRLSGFHPVRARNSSPHLTQVQVQVPCPRPRRHPPVQARPQPTSSTETTHKTASAARTASVLPQPYHHHHHQTDHAPRMPRLTNNPSTIQTPDLVPSVSRPASTKAPDGKPHIVAAPPPLRLASAAAVYIFPTLPLPDPNWRPLISRKPKSPLGLTWNRVCQLSRHLV